MSVEVYGAGAQRIVLPALIFLNRLIPAYRQAGISFLIYRQLTINHGRDLLLTLLIEVYT
jgi:hypothetical protein